jgi:hypothetical protein
LDSTTPARFQRIHAIASACLAEAYFKSSYEPGDDAFEFDPLSKAGFYADISVALGLKSPGVLAFVSALNGADLRHHYLFSKFKTLWDLLDQREREVKSEEEKRTGKVLKAPLAYRCAADGCGIEGKNKAALRRCAGKCPAAMKPSYCSKECQTKVNVADLSDLTRD